MPEEACLTSVSLKPGPAERQSFRSSLLEDQGNTVQERDRGRPEVRGSAEEAPRRLPLATVAELTDSSGRQPASAETHHEDDADGDGGGRCQDELHEGDDPKEQHTDD